MGVISVNLKYNQIIHDVHFWIVKLFYIYATDIFVYILSCFTWFARSEFVFTWQFRNFID